MSLCIWLGAELGSKMIKIRYMVDNVAEAVKFYSQQLGFNLLQQYRVAVAILEHSGVELIVSGPISSAGQPMPDGTKPSPGGGWARFQIVVEDIEAEIGRLKEIGVAFKNELIEGGGRKQILCLDPSGNIIELFEDRQEWIVRKIELWCGG